jgi:hypothetical protein
MPYFPGNGIDKNAFIDKNGRIMKINFREIPATLQFFDWNHWLPRIHPKDILGSTRFYTKIGGEEKYHLPNQHYERILKGLRGELGTTRDEYIDLKFRWDLDIFKNSISGDNNSLPIMYNEIGRHRNPDTYKKTYAAGLWQAVKMWEIANVHKLQELGKYYYGSQGEKRMWPINRMLFNVGPHIITTAYPPGEDRAFNLVLDTTNSVVKDFEFVTNIWYSMHTLLNGGSEAQLKEGITTSIGSTTGFSLTLVIINLMKSTT